MSAGSFSGALSALKAGEFVRHQSWRDEFLVLMGPHEVTIASIGDPKLSGLLNNKRLDRSAPEAPPLRDGGNIRKINLDTGAIENGWTPSAPELLDDGWVTYNAAELEVLKLEWQLEAALGSLCSVRPESLAGLLAGQLTALNIPHVWSSGDPKGWKTITLEQDYEGIFLSVECRNSYKIHTAKEGEVVVGTERLLFDLNTAAQRWLPGGASSREFHRTLLTLEVLSEEKVPEDMRGAEIVREIQQGEFVGTWKTVNEATVNAPTAARLLGEMGSSSEFFRLTDDGKDLERNP